MHFGGRYIGIFVASMVLSNGQDKQSTEAMDAMSLKVANQSISGETFYERLKENVTCPWNEDTVDTFKEGDPKHKITGIVTTFMATQQVLEKAVAQGSNLIVTHEPTFYNHLDARDMVAGHSVYADKLKYIQDHNLMIFRFHDHWHRTNPDGIYVGMIDELGWTAFGTDHKMIFKVPEQSLGDMVGMLKNHFAGSTIRAVGPSEMTFTTVGLSVGAHGGHSEMNLLARPEIELLIVGETREWETVEYVRDAQHQGKRKALIILGHADSEEAGMKYCAKWLSTFISEVPVDHIPAGNPLWSP